MTEEEVLAFLRTTLPSVWALDILLLMRASPKSAWSIDELIRGSRSSVTAVTDALRILNTAGMVVSEGNKWSYSPKNSDLDSMIREIEQLYSVKPTTVIRAILQAPHDKLRTFSDAFKIKE